MKLTKYMKEFDIDEEKSIILNSLTGAVDVISKSVLAKIKQDNIEKNNQAVFSELKRRGYIVKDDEEDVQRLNKLVRTLGKMELGTFILCVTYKCNLNCTYCFEDKEVKRQRYFLTQTDVDKIFEAICKLKEERGFSKISILLYGGEPFLPGAKKIVQYIFERAKQEGYVIQAISNGTSIVEYKDIFAEYKDIIRNIQITLDGNKEFHDKTRKYHSGAGSFDDIVNGIDMCVVLGIAVNLRVNVGKNNIEALDDLLSFIEKKNWSVAEKFICQLAPITDHFCTGMVEEWLPEHIILEQLYPMLKRHKGIKIRLGTDMEKRISILKNVLTNSNVKTLSCLPCSAALRNYFVFGAEGNIYACPETVGIKEQSIGVFKPNFEIYEEKENAWRRDITNIKKCSNCYIAGACGGGCTWSAIATNGSKFEEAKCNYAHETIETFFSINHEYFEILANK